MRQRPFGKLGATSALTLGGGGLGQVWGATTREECVGTVREAVESGIEVLDLAPSYGNGEAESGHWRSLWGRAARGHTGHHQVPRWRDAAGAGLRPSVRQPGRQPGADEAGAGGRHVLAQRRHARG